ncbi:hypothetical protein [Nostoc sp. LPT]|uniref:hypothetical protein n=1 Tax=Nostoc sp. LPT TaxID=2815387 RepID=UPI001DF11FC8|nr:hypothetical protein [Nostoc sp. LPT]MBN4004948.1 hypothetical protein [Nostoc sp. LPT]
MQEKITPFYRPNILFLSGASGVGKTTSSKSRFSPLRLQHGEYDHPVMNGYGTGESCKLGMGAG